jgi:hypothetical protein
MDMGFVRAGWCRETSADPTGWTPNNPAWGQCAVTALVVQDLLGGDLLRARAGSVSHYWNLLADGSEVDLTRDQFPFSTVLLGREVRDRAYVLSFPATVWRYELLRERIQATGGDLGSGPPRG